MVSPVLTRGGGVQTFSGVRQPPLTRRPGGKTADTTAQPVAEADVSMPSPDTVKALFAYYRSIGAIQADPLPTAPENDRVLQSAEAPAVGSPGPEDAGPSLQMAGIAAPLGFSPGKPDTGNGVAAAARPGPGSTGLYVAKPNQDPKFLYLAWDAPLKLAQASRFYDEVLKAADLFPTGTGGGQTA